MSDDQRGLKPGISRDFKLLWAGQSISDVGTQVTALAVPLLAIDSLNASTFEVGALTALQWIPFMLIGLHAGALVDRSRRRRVLILSDIGRGILLATIPIAWWLDVLTLAQLFVVSFLVGCLTVFFDVSYQSFIPSLVPREEIPAANGRIATTESGAYVFGPGVGGLLVNVMGAASTVFIDACSFLVSLLTLSLIKANEEVPERRKAEDGSNTTIHQDIAEGLSFVRNERRIRSIACCTGTFNFFNMMMHGVLVVFMRRQLHFSPGRIGLLIALEGVGGVIGASFAPKVARKFGIGPTLITAIFLAGILHFGYAISTPSNGTVIIGITGAALAVFGLTYNINQVSLRQALCPGPLLGRMNASIRFLVCGTMAIGGMTGGILGATLGLRETLWIAATGALFPGLWMFFSPVRNLRAVPPSQFEDAHEAFVESPLNS